MTATPLGDSRTQPVVDSIFNKALVVQKPARTHDGVVVRRRRGRLGSGFGRYDFGNRYSVPAIVRDGSVVRLA